MKKACEICNGSGQVSYFKGVSRFLVSWEECPECAGLGYKISSGTSGELEEKNSGPEKEENNETSS